MKKPDKIIIYINAKSGAYQTRSTFYTSEMKGVLTKREADEFISHQIDAVSLSDVVLQCIQKVSKNTVRDTDKNEILTTVEKLYGRFATKSESIHTITGKNLVEYVTGLGKSDSIERFGLVIFDLNHDLLPKYNVSLELRNIKQAPFYKG